MSKDVHATKGNIIFYLQQPPQWKVRQTEKVRALLVRIRNYQNFLLLSLKQFHMLYLLPGILPNFYLPGSFNFIFSNPLQRESKMCHEFPLKTLIQDLLVFCFDMTFTYLGSTLTKSCQHWCWGQQQDHESKCGRLCKNIWEHREISRTTELKVYHAIVLTMLLYACETWTVHRRHARQPNHFHMTCPHNSWRSGGRRGYMTQKSSQRPAFKECTLFSRRLRSGVQDRWPACLMIACQNSCCMASFVKSMPDNRQLKQLLYGKLCEEHAWWPAKTAAVWQALWGKALS